jgi:hypothetical protein
MQIPNIDWIRNAKQDDPQLPWKIAESLDAISKGSTTTEQQGNLNAQGQPEPPPNIQSVTATGANGYLHVAIQDNSENLSRGAEYFAEHSAFPDFRDAQIRPMGTSRQIDLPIGNATRYVRAYSAYPSSGPSAKVYHGGALNPTPVSGGSGDGPPAWLPSQGSGTGAPGQSGVGPGPLPKRTSASGVSWMGRSGGPSGLNSAGSQPNAGGGVFGPAAGNNAAGAGTAGVAESVIAAAEWLKSVAGTNTITAKTATPYQSLGAGFAVRIVPANTNSGATTLNVNGTGAKAITKNGTTALSGGELVAGQEYLLVYDGTRWQINGLMASMVSGDATVAATGALTLATVNPDTGTFGDASHTVTLTVNAKGLITAITSNGISFPNPTSAQIVAALGFTPATSGANANFTLTANLTTGAVTGTITQV